MARCQATTKAGTRCKNKAKAENAGLCTIHFRIRVAQAYGSSLAPSAKPAPPDQHFILFLTDVDSRLRNIETSIRKRPIAESETRLNKCNAMLSILLDMAKAQALDLSPHYDRLVGIRQRLLDTHDMVHARREFWRKLLGPIGVAIKLVLNLLGLPTIPRRALPPGRE